METQKDSYFLAPYNVCVYVSAVVGADYVRIFRLFRIVEHS